MRCGAATGPDRQETFGERLRRLRQERGLSLADVAFGARILPHVVSQLERGKKSPTLQLVTRLADYFGVSIDYLLGREDRR